MATLSRSNIKDSVTRVTEAGGTGALPGCAVMTSALRTGRVKQRRCSLVSRDYSQKVGKRTLDESVGGHHR